MAVALIFILLEVKIYAQKILKEPFYYSLKAIYYSLILFEKFKEMQSENHRNNKFHKEYDQQDRNKI